MKNIDLSNVPNKPGIYIWKDKNGEIIYVGKAKRLRERMMQYFKGMLNSYKTATLVDEIIDFEYIISSSEKEALILERNYIDEYHPKYNILLTDDKRYPYIKLEMKKNKLDISLVYRVKSVRRKDIFLFGPYPTGFGARKIVNILQNISMYKDGLPYESNDFQYWKQKFDEAKSILTSGQNKLIKDLTVRMQNAAEKELFEVAQNLKETIESIKINKEEQYVELLDDSNIDAIGVVENKGYLSISILFYRAGTLLSAKDFVIEIISSPKESLRQFISQYYSSNIIPSEIISNEEIDFEKSSVPQKGDKKKIVELAIKNAKENIEMKLQKFIRNEEQTIGAMNKLKNIIGLKKINHILMMDNSNTNNSLPVSVIVSYRNGVKQRKEYRKYILQNLGRNADVEYMRQGIEKYFSKEQNKIPDLFIVDGGVAQINEAKKIIPNINIIGLVKDDKHKTRALINLENKEIEIDDRALFNFLSGMQIEVDKYAKNYHSSRRIQQTLEGSLIQIKGVGYKTEKKLLSTFKSYSAIYNSSLEELTKVVSPEIARNIKEKINK